MNLTTASDLNVGTVAGPQLALALLAPLTHCSLATAPDVRGTIRCWLSPGYVLATPTDYYAYTVTSGQETSSSGMYARGLKTASTVLGKATLALPSFAHITGPLAAAATVGGKVAELLGLGRPPYQGITTVMADAPNADLSQGVGVSAGSYVADLDPSV